MDNRIILLIIGVLAYLNVSAYEQDTTYVAFEDSLYKLEIIVLNDTVLVKDTIFVSQLNDVTRLFNMSFDEYSKRLLDSVADRDSTQRLSLERLYLNYFLPMYYPSYIEHRYTAYSYSVEVKENHLAMGVSSMSKPPLAYQDSVAMDVMLICRGDVNTDNFLKSDHYRSSCLEQLFLSINKTKLTNIKGVNLYFPDFSFKEKRAMAQFIKSASLVVDSCHVESIKGLRLYATFDKENGEKNKNYLFGLTQMVDSVLLVDSKDEAWPRKEVEVLCKEKAEKLSWWSKVVNQLYLARFTLEPFPEINKNEELSPKNLRQLINADYPYNNWELYFCALMIIVSAIAVVVILYRFSPRFSYFLNNNMAYFFSLIIMLILEMYLLFVCMIEAMSNENVFTFGGEDKNTFLLLPLLFIFIIPMLNIIAKKKDKP